MKYVVVYFLIFLSGCQGSKVNLEQSQTFEQKAPIPENQPQQIPTHGFGFQEWYYEDFKNYWILNTEPEQRKELLLNIEQLSNANFNWEQFTFDFTENIQMRPTLKDLRIWSLILQVIEKVYLNKKINTESWRKLTLHSPRPLGLEKLFHSRTLDETAFTADEWKIILTILTKSRKHGLGLGVAETFITILEYESENIMLWKDAVFSTDLWTNLQQDFPNDIADYENKKAKALELAAKTLKQLEENALELAIEANKQK